MSMPWVAAIAVISSLAAGVALAAEPGTVAVLNALDKITARVSRLEAPIGQPVHFGTLEITVRACYQTQPEETPETKAFLEIRDLHRNDEAVLVFSGWMFASSPALSALEHPVYDVWVLSCSASSPKSPSGSAEKSAAPTMAAPNNFR